MNLDLKDDLEIRRVMKSAIFGGGGPLTSYISHTKLFNDFSPEIQNTILSQFQCNPLELPVFGCFRNNLHWILVTTRRYIWLDALGDGQIIQLRIDEIKNVTYVGSPSDKRFKMHSDFHFVDKCLIPGKPPNNPRPKLPAPYDQICAYQIANPWLLIEENSGRLHEIYIEYGAVVGGAFEMLFQVLSREDVYEKCYQRTL